MNLVEWISPNREDIEYFEVGKQVKDFGIDIIARVNFTGPSKKHSYRDTAGKEGDLYFIRHALIDNTLSDWEGPYKIGPMSPRTVKIFGYSSEITGNPKSRIRVQVEISPHQNIFFTETGQFLIQKEIFATSDEEGYFEINLIPTDKIRPAETTYTIKISDQTNTIIICLEKLKIEDSDKPINISKLIRDNFSVNK